MSLRLDWCSHEAAKYAVEHWHYSKRMPMPPLAKIGVWENEFIGCVLFARGNTATLGKPYGLTQYETCELVRVALRKHKTAVSRIVSIAIKMIRKQYRGLRLIVSFADPSMGHNGAIYQAMNWIYCGMSDPDKMYFYQGRWQHSREIRGGAFGGTRKLKDYSSLSTKEAPRKFRYLYPLDDLMRKQIEPLRKPYPKRVSGEIDSAAEPNPQTGGASPTETLLVSDASEK